MLDYAQFPPPKGIAGVVKCFWMLRGTPERRRGGLRPPPDKIVPDGYPEIVINRADPFLEQGIDGEASPQGDVLVAGQMTRPLLLRPAGAVDLLGIRMRAEGLHTLLGIDASELTNQRVDLQAIDRRLLDRLRCAAQADSLPLLLARVGAEIERSIERTRSSTGTAWLPQAIELLRTAHDGIRMRRLYDAAHVSPRQMQRTFLREVGLPPKTMARVFRFQRIYAALEAGGARATSGLALSCGYYDQSHLIRDFQEFAGRSPTTDHGEQELLARLFSTTPPGRAEV